MTAGDHRARQLQQWLVRQPGQFDDLHLLRADASFRRYFRACRDGTPVVIMDAPPPREATEPFVRIAGLLQQLELRPPRILEHDPQAGFVLLEDLGDRTFTRALAEGMPEEPLYRRAIDTLIRLHRNWPRHAAGAPPLPAYDRTRLMDEVRLFPDWYWPEFQDGPMPGATRQAFEEAWRQTLEALPPLPDTLVLRDFHVDNLMLPPEGGDDCAVLDFQDAVLGSPAYDVVSLLEDARRDVSPATAQASLAHYLEALDWPRDTFLAHYRVLGVQRTVKILGIFVRLARRDAKPRYLEHLPRLHRLLDAGLAHPELEPVAHWFARHLPQPAAARGERTPCAP